MPPIQPGRTQRIAAVTGCTSRAFVSIMLSVVCFLSIFANNSSFAADLDYVNVERNDTHFIIDFRIVLQVTQAQARDYLTDYDVLARVSPTTIESGLITTADSDRPLLRVVLKPCVLIFCKTLIKVSEVHEAHVDDDIFRRYVVKPELSNFKQATETLSFEDNGDGDGTMFVYHAKLEPDFYVPGFIGAWLIRRTLVEDLLLTGQAVEQAHAD